MEAQFNDQKYLVRRKILTFMGAKFHVYNSTGQLMFFSKLKALRMREDIRIYTGEDMTTELISIRARKVLDISSVYDVIDNSTGLKVGALKRRGLKSMLRDEWAILGINDEELGTIQEDSMVLALLRRLLSNLIPQSYNVQIGGVLVSTFKQNFNPFVIKLNLDFTNDTAGVFDKRLGIAAGILLCAIDGKQS